MHLYDCNSSAYNEFPVLLLEPLVSLTQLVGHQFVLIPLLLAGVQLFRQNQKSFFFTLQFTLTNEELQKEKKLKGLHTRIFNNDGYLGRNIFF